MDAGGTEGRDPPCSKPGSPPGANTVSTSGSESRHEGCILYLGTVDGAGEFFT